MEVELKCQALQLECRTLKKAVSEKGGQTAGYGQGVTSTVLFCRFDFSPFLFRCCVFVLVRGCFRRKAFLGMMWSLFYLLQELQDTKAALRGLANCCCFGDLGLMG